MLKYIIIHEIADHVKSLRFMLTLTVVIVLFGVSAFLFVSDYHDYSHDYDQSRSEMLSQISERASRNGGLFYITSFNYDSFWIQSRPNLLGFISEGQEHNLPNAFQPSAFRVYGPTKHIRSNILLWRSDAIDWSFIIGVILSFVALILVYDGISGDREDGTLRLSLSNHVSRTTVLAGKFLGALSCIGSALAIGMLISVLIITTAGGIPLSLNDLTIIVSVFALAIVYLSAFLMLGLFISTMVRESATSVVIALLCWALLVIVIPRSGGLVAARLRELPSWSDAIGNAYDQERETTKSYNEKHPDLASIGTSGHWSPSEPLERAIVMGDAWTNSFDAYRNGMIDQVETARKMTMISPYSAFTAALENCAESGIIHYRTFFGQVQNYRLAMKQYLLDMYTLPLDWNAWNSAYRTPEYAEKAQKLMQPVDPDGIPIFDDIRSSSIALMNGALPYALLLMLFNLVFFSAAFVSFLRYDVR